MAGKKKNVQDAPQSKTARASLGKKKAEGFQASADMDRFISLGGGTYCYLSDPRDGKTHHLEVGSDRYNRVVTDLLDSTHGDRIRTEMLKKGYEFPAVPEPVEV